MGEKRGVYRALVGKPEGKSPLGRPGVDGLIIEDRSSGSEMCSMDWIELAQDMGRWRALVITVINLRVP